MKVVVIGGVATGMSAAARLRRLNEQAEIVVFERGEYVSFANCGLPYYIGEVIEDRDNLVLQTPESFKQRFNITVKINSEVISINKEAKTVTVKDVLSQQTRTENYDKLIIAPGAEPIRANIPGINLPGIFSLRTLPDTDKIVAHIKSKVAKRALVVGGGFIGLEMAENLHHLGLEVAVVEMANQVMSVIDFEMASIIHRHLEQKQVELYLSDAVTSFVDQDGQIVVKLSSGKELIVDMVILSIGVRPEIKLAKEGGLEIGARNGIVVNEYLQTSDPDIYAGGDAIEVFNPILKQMTLVPLAGPANKQGRIIANNIALGNTYKFLGSIATAIAKVFDLTVAVTGATEKQLSKANIGYKVAMVHVGSHAGYYPGAIPMSIKLLFSSEDARILGAEIIGEDGVDRRIDIFALAIANKLTIFSLTEFEHAYAPPYSSAKDPVNMAAFVAENIFTHKMEPIYWQEMASLDRNTTVILDVRTPYERQYGKIEGSLNIPVDELREKLPSLPRDKDIVIYCAVGLRGYLATRILTQLGFLRVKNLIGGYKTMSYLDAK